MTLRGGKRLSFRQISADVVRLPPMGEDAVFIVRGGNARAVLMIDSAHPGQMNVASAYAVVDPAVSRDAGFPEPPARVA